jgi:hypothetical protein
MENEIKEITKNEKKIQKINYFNCHKCKNFISLEINPHNFSVSYDCEKDNKREDIYFSSINQFLSANATEDELDKLCNNCNKSKGLDYFAYCKGCKIHLCPFCVGNHLKTQKKNQKHDIVFLGNITPSEEEILETKKNLNERVTLINKLIEKIERVKDRFCLLSDNLIHILKEEIKFTSNFINNFSLKFPNYQYLTNYHTIKEYISSIKNKKLNEFEKENEFNKQINLLMEISDDISITKKQLEQKIKLSETKKLCDYQRISENPFGELKYTSFTSVDFCKRDNNFIFSYDSILKFYHLLKNNTIYLDYEYNFKTTINAFILTKNEEELIISENGYIYILPYDETEKKFIMQKNKENNKYIIFNGGRKINYLYLLSDYTLITLSDDGKMGVWKRNFTEEIPNKKSSEKIYELVKVIASLWSCYELLQVNNQYFIGLMRDCNLKFFDCDEVNEIKTVKIKFGDYIREKFKHMVKINNEYVIIGVKNIYALLSIKYMEIVQYFVLPNIKNIISIFKYDFDNMVLFVAKAADEENIFYQYKFDEEDKILKEISHFENKAEKYGDYRFYFVNYNMIISQYYYYSAGANKKFELFA